MSIQKGTPVFMLAAACACARAFAQDAPSKELTARELFYAAVEAAKPAPKAVTPKAAPAKPASQGVASRVQPPTAPGVTAPTHAPKTATPDSAPVIPAAVRRTAPAPAAGAPLGLRYTITKLVDGQMVEVPADTVFHGGDRIKITVVPNGPGYLYIVNQGSSGTWKPIFPSPEVADGNNKVDGLREYVLPPKSRMVFDSQPGVERLFVVLSREPEPDLEQMIYSLQAPAKAKPAADEPAPAAGPPRTMVAANISNDTVGRMRNVYARDLVIESVDEETAGEKKEKAVYVVNPSGSRDSRVVADIALVHQ